MQVFHQETKLIPSTHLSLNAASLTLSSFFMHTHKIVCHIPDDNQGVETHSSLQERLTQISIYEQLSNSEMKTFLTSTIYMLPKGNDQPY